MLREKGFTKTNISDVAEAAGYTRGAFYFHFDSKEDFFLHVLKNHDAKRGDWATLPYQFHPETTSLEEVLTVSFSSLWKRIYEEPMNGWLLVAIDFEEAALQLIMTTYGFMVTYYMYDKKDLSLLIRSCVKILS